MSRHPVARAVHRLALAAYPRSFRRAFGDELARVFEERVTAAAGWPRRTALAAFLIADALISGVAERARHHHEEWTWPRHRAAARTEGSQTMTWDSLWADMRLALRQVRRAPFFAALIVAWLALGIGANSAMFGAVQAVLLRPLPYADPGALVMIWSDNTNNNEKPTPSRRQTTKPSKPPLRLWASRACTRS